MELITLPLAVRDKMNENERIVIDGKLNIVSTEFGICRPVRFCQQFYYQEITVRLMGKDFTATYYIAEDGTMLSR